jgi:hypothetical protein
MIIGINGKIGSGKDTVGKIIQCLTQGINSEKQIVDYCNGVKITGFDWKLKKFAGKLKQIASLLTGVPVEKFEDQEFKQKHMGLEWEMTYREFLQKLGTEAMRDGLHTNVWVNALFADYKAKWVPTGDSVAKEDVSLEKEYPNWIITDMRFPNEKEAVEEREGITIRVVRPVHALSQENHCGLLHPSETSLDSAEFDYTIVNDSTIEDLVEKVREILIKEEII